MYMYHTYSYLKYSIHDKLKHASVRHMLLKKKGADVLNTSQSKRHSQSSDGYLYALESTAFISWRG